MQRIQRVIITIPDEGIDRFDKAVAVARTMRPGLSRAAAIREGMILWEVSVIPAMLATHGRAEEVAELMVAIERDSKPGLAEVMAEVKAKLKAGRVEG